MMNEKKGKNEKFSEVVFIVLTFLISFLTEILLILNIGLGAAYGAYRKWPITVLTARAGLRIFTQIVTLF